MIAVAAVLAGGALLAWPDAARRDRGRGEASVLRWWPVIAAGIATVAIAPGLWWLGAPVAALVAVAIRVTGRRPHRRSQHDIRSLARTLDLIAACLLRGVTLSDALRAATTGLAAGDASGRLLGTVAALLAVGAEPELAWEPVRTDPDLGPIAAAAIRSARGGVALAAAFSDQAKLLRTNARTLDAGRAGRAGVLITAPLAVCFLPAFLCLGPAPVVIGLVSGIHPW